MVAQGDVEGALVQLVLGAVGGLGWPVQGFRGWPLAASLERGLREGVVTVTVRGRGGWRETTRWPAEWRAVPGLAGLGVSVSGDVASFSGMGGVGVVAGVAVGGESWAYRCRAGDTPELVAASLGALVRADRAVVVSGASLRVVGAAGLLARTGADAVARRELRRQEQVFEVGLWCPCPEARDAAGLAVDVVVGETAFLDVQGEGCRMLGHGVVDDDGAETARLYKRVVAVTVEYPTVEIATQAAMLFGVAVQDGAVAGEVLGVSYG